jgi:hypothetical protein
VSGLIGNKPEKAVTHYIAKYKLYKKRSDKVIIHEDYMYTNILADVKCSEDEKESDC